MIFKVIINLQLMFNQEINQNNKDKSISLRLLLFGLINCWVNIVLTVWCEYIE